MSHNMEPEPANGTPAQNDKKGSSYKPIPQPPVHWFTKNIPELDPTFPIASVWRLADIYGEIYQLDLVTQKTVVISTHELINEVLDENRFEKNVSAGLREVRALAGDGLFTAYGNEPNWWKAHRILMPVFGPLAIKKMFPDMLDIASQIILRWDRYAGQEVTVSDDFTITFCSFSYRFNSFYLPGLHPFAIQMAEVLVESGRRAAQTTIETRMRIFAAQHNKENIEKMWKLCDDLVAERKANPQPDCKDLLNTMLNATDPVTGEHLSDENIRFNMVTFLVAGHETTSGTLAFLWYHLLKNPEKYHKAQAEVDEIVGDNALDIKHIPKLVYIQACLREALRFQGPINSISLTPKQDEVIGGRYQIAKGTNIQINMKALHHDPKVWGTDADIYRPERFLNGGYEALPPNAWKPFGNGMRGCIGRAFAEQEMMMITALIMQRFQVTFANPSYNLALKSTMTIKPDGLGIIVRRRTGKSWLVGLAGGTSSEAVGVTGSAAGQSTTTSAKNSLLVLYGSNSGTCKALAEDLESFVGSRFSVTVSTLDNSTEHLPKQGNVVIITPSYEGKPADNAKKFVTWLESSSDPRLLEGVNFALFGVGNSEWVHTYHRIPKLVDDMMPELGAKRVFPAGFADAKEDVISSWDEWKIKLVEVLLGSGAAPIVADELKIEVGKSDTATKMAGDEISFGFVRKNEVLCEKEVGCEKRHMTIELPVGTTYRTGDYIVVLPINPIEDIKRVMTRFKLSPEDTINITGTHKAFLKSEAPLTAMELIGGRVELAMPVTQRQLQTIADTATSDTERAALQKLCTESSFKSDVLEKRISILDLLDDFPSCSLTLEQYLDMLRPLSPREYSISSSPLPHENGASTPITASITFDVQEFHAKSGNGRMFRGVASTYLAQRNVGAKVHCFVRATNANFHLPKDPEVPVIMICAGTGIAPMRGFIEERAQLAKAGSRKLGKALLYFGCRDFEKDFIYKDDLKAWESLNAIDLRLAFSQRGPEGNKYRYVYNRMWDERSELSSLFLAGAKIFVCGSASRLASSSADVCMRIWREKHPEASEEDAFEWLQEQREERYVSDVFD